MTVVQLLINPAILYKISPVGPNSWKKKKKQKKKR